MEPSIDHRDAVRNLQRYLRRVTREYDEIVFVPIDGIFDDRTEEALIVFQERMELTPTGRADAETYGLLFLEYDRLKKEEDARVPIDFFPSMPEQYTAAPPERSAFIALLQFMLGELTLVYDAYERPLQTGEFDGATEEALRRFQKIHGLEETGRLDRLTWNRLSGEYRNYLT